MYDIIKYSSYKSLLDFTNFSTKKLTVALKPEKVVFFIFLDWMFGPWYINKIFS